MMTSGDPATTTQEHRSVQRMLMLTETLMLDDSRITFQHVDWAISEGVGIGGHNALARKYVEYIHLMRDLKEGRKTVGETWVM